ncbi:hypothetical protein BIT28_25875 [Photobacterium proteolyticum]|uniref:Chromosome partitioning protein ParA n=1 Tax=Photobacterium proteolyticum TaxID=1903952 RepID=A0A1Q9GUB9_9GAMM|nr:hypothetical protein [Photobacterium proteolyticum]OLQ78754.1 hypothetical protein BIT28_25875 [Photobacterium proteolyticum]
MKPWLSAEYDQLFHKIHQLDARVITLAGASPGCGTSTQSMWLARRCAEDQHSVLLIDLDLSGSGQGYPSGPWQSDGTGESDVIIHLDQQLDLLPQPSVHRTILDLRQPQMLAAALERWKKNYHYIICDIGTISTANWQNLPITAISHISDASILCLAAAQTTESELLTSMTKLEQGGVRLLGTLINDKSNPSLSQEIIRVLHGKARWIPETIKRRLIHYLQHNPLLLGKYQ